MILLFMWMQAVTLVVEIMTTGTRTTPAVARQQQQQAVTSRLDLVKAIEMAVADLKEDEAVAGGA